MCDVILVDKEHGGGRLRSLLFPPAAQQEETELFVLFYTDRQKKSRRYRKEG